jgi:rubrerythrin
MSDNRTEALKQALKMEEDGHSYYKQAREKTKDKMAKWVFKYLIEAEETHIKKITQLFKSLEETGKWPDVVLARDDVKKPRSIFASALNQLDNKVKGTTEDIEALRLALDFEHKGQKYYQSKAETTEDPFEKKFYLLLSHEEGEHLISLLDTIEYLEDPQGYFSQLERGTLSF